MLAFGGFHLLWIVLALILSRRAARRFRDHDPAEKGRKPGDFRAGGLEQLIFSLHFSALVLVVAFLALIAPYIEAARHESEIFRKSADAYLLTLAGLVAPHSLCLYSYLTFTARLTREQLGSGMRKRDSRKLLALRIAYCVTVAAGAALGLALYFDQISVGHLMIGLFALVVFLGLAVRVSGVAPTPPAGSSAKLDLEESPLRTEIERVIRATEGEPKTIRIMPRSRKTRLRESTPLDVARRHAVWWAALRSDNVGIPQELTEGISADALTAGLASRFTREAILRGRNRANHPAGRWYRRHYKLMTVLQVISIALFLTISLTITIIGSPAIGYVFLLPVAGVILLKFSELFLFIVRMRRVRNLAALETTLETWRAGEPGEERSMRDYLLRVSEFNLALNPHMPARLLLRMTFGSPGIIAYMDTLTEADAAALRAEITEVIERGAADESAASGEASASDPAPEIPAGG